MSARLRAVALSLLVGACSRHQRAPLPPPADVRGGEDGFLKGQLHLHSNRSGDSATPPEEVVRWYAARGYDFIVFTDHDRVTAPPSTASMLVIPGVELTQNLRHCTPPPPPGLKCLLHVNALFVRPPFAGLVPWGWPGGDDRLGRYRRALAVTKELGGIAQLNHPNFHYAADARLVTALAADGLTLMEVANQAWDSNNEPTDGHPSTEAIWDAVLSTGATLYGTATDDAHHYDDADAARARGDEVFVGDLGFVMVRARKDPAAIRDALARGDFYASTGPPPRWSSRPRTARRGRTASPSSGSTAASWHGRRDGAPASRWRTPPAATCGRWSSTIAAAKPGSSRSASPEDGGRAPAPPGRGAAWAPTGCDLRVTSLRGGSTPPRPRCTRTAPPGPA